MQNEIFIAIFGILSICRSYNLCWIGILTIKMIRCLIRVDQTFYDIVRHTLDPMNLF